MNKLYINAVKYSAIALLAGSIYSCNLDVVPPSDIAVENFWKTEKDAFFALNACYAKMPGMDIWDEMCTDNAHSHKPWEGPYELIQLNGLTAESDRGYNFSTIRIVNNFLENVDKCNMSESLRERMKAEARFFRAISYLDLTTKFGKVAIITEVLAYDAPPVARNSVEEVQEFILSELESIASVLPATYDGSSGNERGRITSLAAHALRARAALYFKNYTEAEKSAAAVIESNQHALFRISELNDAQKQEANEMGQYIDFEAKGIDKDKFIKGMFSYETLWHKENANPRNPEYILTRGYMADPNNYDGSRYTYIRPSQLVSGYCSYEPMQDMIDAYWDIDGKTIRPEISKDERANNYAAIYNEVKDLDQMSYIKKVPTMDLTQYEYMQEFRNRDSRLYASMLFPFKGWHETDFQGGTFYYRFNPDKAGVDGNESYTGYVYRKMVALQAYDNWANVEDYPVIRYAEVLLTYAEARVQNTGWDTEVQNVLNDLRDRCGMPNVPATMASKTVALDFVRNERRIELAAEGHRYDDMRRYGTEYCASVMNGPTYAPNGYKVVDKAWSDRLLLMP
ncbi:MAG: RagB/SusD family nutrient uptake outer membrane protein, partial [Bacteroidales bacterium]